MSDPIDIVERLAGMSADHGPDGWPAVQMRDISALCDEVGRLRAALAAQAPQWLPIESAPKDGRTIIVAREMGDFGGWVKGHARWHGGTALVSGWVSHGFDPVMSNLGLAHPTHWMPLPAAPGASPPPAALAVPAGMALVPVEPTEAMEDAAMREITDCAEDFADPDFRVDFRVSYRAAIAAASQ